MKLFWLIAIVVVAFAQLTLGYQDYGQGKPSSEEYCLGDSCDSLMKCPDGFVEKEGEGCVPADCGCGGH
uniref:TIL domain-containing protein n=1 Tax=Anopheles dirus TaxID=7168 RepID=A0A182NIT8_9DIPT